MEGVSHTTSRSFSSLSRLCFPRASWLLIPIAASLPPRAVPTSSVVMASLQPVSSWHTLPVTGVITALEFPAAMASWCPSSFVLIDEQGRARGRRSVFISSLAGARLFNHYYKTRILYHFLVTMCSSEIL
jgi:hypothetical protein